MNTRIFVLLIALVLILGSVSAYSGFNREYYTNYYKPTYYYNTPYQSYAYNYSYPTRYTYTTNYYDYGYPNYRYSYNYYPVRTYGTYIAPVYSGRNISIYSNDSGWGISYGSGNICSIYGYC